jgi:hypothetical protein
MPEAPGSCSAGRTLRSCFPAHLRLVRPTKWLCRAVLRRCQVVPTGAARAARCHRPGTGAGSSRGQASQGSRDGERSREMSAPAGSCAHAPGHGRSLHRRFAYPQSDPGTSTFADVKRGLIERTLSGRHRAGPLTATVLAIRLRFVFRAICACRFLFASIDAPTDQAAPRPRQRRNRQVGSPAVGIRPPRCAVHDRTTGFCIHSPVQSGVTFGWHSRDACIA